MASATLVLLTSVVMAGYVYKLSLKKEIKWVNKPDIPIANFEHLVLNSKYLGHEVGIGVKLPADYESSNKNYNVLYFLHGAGGNEISDVAGISGFIKSILKELGLADPIIVMPNGGDSQYQGQVEPMIIEELIPYIDNHYRTKAQPQTRLAAGFSMGGAGAIRLSIRHPNTFGGAISWAGGMWSKDFKLLADAAINSGELRDNQFFALMINGEYDRPTVFVQLEKVFNEVRVEHKRVVLPGVDHNFGHYLELSKPEVTDFLQRSWGTPPPL